MKIGIIRDIDSIESKESIENAEDVFLGLTAHEFECVFIDCDDKMIQNLKDENINTAFICTGSKYYGSGMVQSILDFMGISYTGPLAMSSSIMNNKIACKNLWAQDIYIKTLDYFTFKRDKYKEGKSKFSSEAEKLNGFPIIVRPIEGSLNSEILRINSIDEYEKIGILFEENETLIVEKAITGRYISQPVIDFNGTTIVLPFTDVSALYNEGKFQEYGWHKHLDVKIPLELESRISDMSIRSYKACFGNGYGQVDYIISEEQEPYVMGINGVPSLKKGGLMHRSAIRCDVPLENLHRMVLQNVKRRRKNR